MVSAVDEIINDIPMDQLAAELNVDEQTAESAARQAIPALLGGLQANATDPNGEASLAGALNEHSGELLDGGVNLNEVNTDDGQKIVSNIFGGNTDQVAERLGGVAGIDKNALIKKLLPILAPIVLAYLAKQVKGTKYGDILGQILAGASGGASGTGGGALKDVLDQVLGGSAQQPAPQAPQETPQQSGGKSIMDMLGDLLGGGRR